MHACLPSQIHLRETDADTNLNTNVLEDVAQEVILFF